MDLLCHVFLQYHLQYSMVYFFNQLHKKCQLTFSSSIGINALCIGESDAKSQVTKYSEYGSPAACTYSPAVKSGTESYTEDMQMEKLPIIICSYQFPLCVCYEPQGESFQLITLLFQMLSLSQIKRHRQEKPIRSKEGKKQIWVGRGEILQKCNGALERREGEQWLCVFKNKKSNLEKFIEAGFYDKWSCVGLDGKRSKGAMCHRFRRRLFKACQHSSFLSHSYLVCLDRHSTKGEQRKRHHGHNWHVERMALHYIEVKPYAAIFGLSKAQRSQLSLNHKTFWWIICSCLFLGLS